MSGKRLVSEIRSLFFFDVGINLFSKVIFILPKITVYSDNGNSVTYGFITIWDRREIDNGI